jgi:methionyl-tRNA synthetase
MVKKYCQGQGPQLTAADLSEDNALLLLGQNLGDRVTESYDKLALSEGGQEIFTLIRACNKYIDETAPWSLYKQQQQQEVEKFLYSVLESIRLAAYLLSPIIPHLSTEIYHQLGFSVNFNDWAELNEAAPFEEHGQWGALPANIELNAAKPIFTRLELPVSNG